MYEPVRRDDEDMRVYGQVFAVAAADVEPNGSSGEALEETLYDRPGLRVVNQLECWIGVYSGFAGLWKMVVAITLYLVDEKCDAICW